MKISSRIKDALNAVLLPLGLRIQTTLLDRLEQKRLEALKNAGYFEKPAFPLPACVSDSQWKLVIDCVKKFRGELEKFSDETNSVGYRANNGFYVPPDSDVLYSLLRHFQPKVFLEIGSGNSTRLARQAIRDGNLDCKIVSIDPSPRADITGFADTIYSVPVEVLNPADLASMLQPGDVLFVDSSHICNIGSDCTYEFLRLIPLLKQGVIVHVHDVSLPWDYPPSWFEREPGVLPWNEQYLLQSLISNGSVSRVVWPGYWVQKNNALEFDQWFPSRNGKDATSFWFFV